MSRGPSLTYSGSPVTKLKKRQSRKASRTNTPLPNSMTTKNYRIQLATLFKKI